MTNPLDLKAIRERAVSPDNDAEADAVDTFQIPALLEALEGASEELAFRQKGWDEAEALVEAARPLILEFEQHFRGPDLTENSLAFRDAARAWLERVK